MSSTSYTSDFSERFPEGTYQGYQELIRRCADVSDWAVRCVRNGDMERTKLSLELREMALYFNEEYQRLRCNLDDFDEQLYKGRLENVELRKKREAEAKEWALRAVNSQVLLREVEVLEKKVEILRDSILNLHKDYYQYGRSVDVKEVLEQVSEMAYRVRRKETDLIRDMLNATGAESPESVLKSAIEGLLGLTTKDPELRAEAKKLAAELRPIRDAAINNNLLALVGVEKSSSVASLSSTMSATSASAPASASTSATSATSSASSAKKKKKDKGRTAKFVYASTSKSASQPPSTKTSPAVPNASSKSEVSI